MGATPHRGAGTALHRGARAFHYRGPSRCGAQAPDAQAQYSWLTGPAAPWHVGSSQTRARTRVPCISRQILNHCATREARIFYSLTKYIYDLRGKCQGLALEKKQAPLPYLAHVIISVLSSLSARSQELCLCGSLLYPQDQTHR